MSAEALVTDPHFCAARVLRILLERHEHELTLVSGFVRSAGGDDLRYRISDAEGERFSCSGGAIQTSLDRALAVGGPVRT